MIIHIQMPSISMHLVKIVLPLIRKCQILVAWFYILICKMCQSMTTGLMV